MEPCISLLVKIVPVPACSLRSRNSIYMDYMLRPNFSWYLFKNAI